MKHEPWELKQMQTLPFEVKLEMARKRVRMPVLEGLVPHAPEGGPEALMKLLAEIKEETGFSDADDGGVFFTVLSDTAEKEPCLARIWLEIGCKMYEAPECPVYPFLFWTQKDFERYVNET